MLVPTNWKDYELLDAGDGMRLERWKDFIFARPDPIALWPKSFSENEWQKADAYYIRSKTGGGKWHFRKELPEKWVMGYQDLKFWVRPTGFKHMGLFPEQAVNWEWMAYKIQNAKGKMQNSNLKFKILNLFAYTGGATVACAKAGAEVTHVDSAKGMVAWAKENCALNKVGARYIVDDVIKFVEREKRRENRYDAIIMDPPSYGRGTEGETWKIETMIWPLVKSCLALLSEQPLFFLFNSYTTGLSPTVMENILYASMKNYAGKISSGELGLKMTGSGLDLQAGVFGRWEV